MKTNNKIDGVYGLILFILLIIDLTLIGIFLTGAVMQHISFLLFWVSSFLILVWSFTTFGLFWSAINQYLEYRNILQNCAICGHTVHRSAKSCPGCGNPDTSKDATFWGVALWITLAFLVLSGGRDGSAHVFELVKKIMG
jgi:hypothetical membrane protein